MIGQTDDAESVLALLSEFHLSNLVTVSPSGWPIAACMHFVLSTDEAGAPLVYMFTHYGTRKLLNIAQQPRVSVSFTHTEAPEGAAPLCWVRLQGRASLVMDLVERNAVKAISHAREGYEFTKLLDLDRQPLLRVDVERADYTPPEGGVRTVRYPTSAPA